MKIQIVIDLFPLKNQRPDVNEILNISSKTSYTAMKPKVVTGTRVISLDNTIAILGQPVCNYFDNLKTS